MAVSLTLRACAAPRAAAGGRVSRASPQRVPTRASAPCTRLHAPVPRARRPAAYRASALSVTVAATASDETLVGGGEGGGGGSSGGDGGGGGDEGDGGEEPLPEDNEPLLTLAEAQSLSAKADLALPADMAACAAESGLRLSALQSYLGYAKSPFLRALMASAWLRDRLLGDPLLLWKLGCELGLDFGLATFTELRRRGGDFWSEAEFFAADLAVGSVLDVALVTLIATPATLGRSPAVRQGILGALQRLPAAALGFAPAGVRYSKAQRALSVLLKGAQYGAVGMACGLTGQAMANTAALTRRALRPKAENKSKAEDEYEELMPSIPRTALLWASFMAGSANVRYQLLAGLDTAVGALPVSKRYVALPALVTAAARFANNIVGGEHFAQQARWAGVQ